MNLRHAGHILDPYRTDLYPQVAHFQMSSLPDERHDLTSPSAHAGDVFVFPSGTVVAWDVDEEPVQKLIAGVLRFAAINAHPSTIETEDLDYYEDPQMDKSTVIGDTIKLGTRPLQSTLTKRGESTFELVGGAKESHQAHESAIHHLNPKEQQEYCRNLINTKIAFSSALARSTKIAVLESLLDKYFANTQNIPRLLSQGARLPFGRSFVLRRTGELLLVRAQLNLTELTDRLPDMFWDSDHELGLENCFKQVEQALDVGIRIKTSNERINYAQEIATVIRETLSEKHSLLLEWLIIGLIALEVGVEGYKMSREWSGRKDEESVENMMHRWLTRELAKDAIQNEGS